MGGEDVDCIVKLRLPCVVEPGMRFTCRESNKTIATGVFTEILPDDATEEESKDKKKK